MKLKKEYIGYRFNLLPPGTNHETIEKMYKESRVIKYGTAYKYIGSRNLAKTFSDYGWGKGSGKLGGPKTMKQDSSLIYCLSVHSDKECVYIISDGSVFIFI